MAKPQESSSLEKTLCQAISYGNTDEVRSLLAQINPNPSQHPQKETWIVEATNPNNNRAWVSLPVLFQYGIPVPAEKINAIILKLQPTSHLSAFLQAYLLIQDSQAASSSPKKEPVAKNTVAFLIQFLIQKIENASSSDELIQYWNNAASSLIQKTAPSEYDAVLKKVKEKLLLYAAKEVTQSTSIEALNTLRKKYKPILSIQRKKIFSSFYTVQSTTSEENLELLIQSKTNNLNYAVYHHQPSQNHFPELAQAIQLGDLKRVELLLQQLKDPHQDINFCFPNGESLLCFAARATSFFALSKQVDHKKAQQYAQITLLLLDHNADPKIGKIQLAPNTFYMAEDYAKDAGFLPEFFAHRLIKHPAALLDSNTHQPKSKILNYIQNTPRLQTRLAGLLKNKIKSIHSFSELYSFEKQYGELVQYLFKASPGLFEFYFDTQIQTLDKLITADKITLDEESDLIQWLNQLGKKSGQLSEKFFAAKIAKAQSLQEMESFFEKYSNLYGTKESGNRNRIRIQFKSKTIELILSDSTTEEDLLAWLNAQENAPSDDVLKACFQKACSLTKNNLPKVIEFLMSKYSGSAIVQEKFSTVLKLSKLRNGALGLLKKLNEVFKNSPSPINTLFNQENSALIQSAIQYLLYQKNLSGDVKDQIILWINKTSPAFKTLIFNFVRDEIISSQNSYEAIQALMIQHNLILQACLANNPDQAELQSSVQGTVPSRVQIIEKTNLKIAIHQADLELVTQILRRSEKHLEVILDNPESHNTALHQAAYLVKNNLRDSKLPKRTQILKSLFKTATESIKTKKDSQGRTAAELLKKPQPLKPNSHSKQQPVIQKQASQATQLDLNEQIDWNINRLAQPASPPSSQSDPLKDYTALKTACENYIRTQSSRFLLFHADSKKSLKLAVALSVKLQEQSTTKVQEDFSNSLTVLKIALRKSKKSKQARDALLSAIAEINP